MYTSVLIVLLGGICLANVSTFQAKIFVRPNIEMSHCRVEKRHGLLAGDQDQGCIVDHVCHFLEEMEDSKLANISCPLNKEINIITYINCWQTFSKCQCTGMLVNFSQGLFALYH